LSDVTAKFIIYEAFIEGAADLPKHLASRVVSLVKYRFSLQREALAPLFLLPFCPSLSQ
jgi:hypothetical protein